MAAKIFASKVINSTTWDHVVTGLSGHEATITINISNHNNYDAKISLALTNLSSIPLVSAKDVLFLDQIIYSRSTRQFPGIILPENISLAIKSDSPNVSILVYGYEEEI